MDFDALPDDCLLLIFHQCSIQEMIRVRGVNSRWYSLVQLMCRGKQSLKLFGSFRGLVDYTKRLKRYGQNEKNSDFQTLDIGSSELIIRIGHLTMETLLFVTELFPNVRTLVFFYFSWPHEEKLQLLINQFNRLTSLTLHGMPAAKSAQDCIWEMINDMPHLKRLHMFANDRVAIPENMPVLRELEQFSLTNYKQADIVPVLSQLGPACKVLLLDQVELSVEKLEAIFEAAPHLAQSLTHLFLGSISPQKTTRPPPQPALNVIPGAEFFQAAFIAPLVFMHNVHDRDGMRVQMRRRLVDPELMFGFPNDLPALPPPLPPRAPRNRAAAMAANSKRILQFVCSNCLGLENLDVTFMLNNSYETFKFSQVMEHFAKLNLKSLRLQLKLEDLSVDNGSIKPLESIRHLQLELFPISVDRLLTVMPAIFPRVERLTAECYDQQFLKQLVASMDKNKPFELLRYRRIYYQRDLLKYFANLGYADRYRDYMQEQMGVMADLL